MWYVVAFLLGAVLAGLACGAYAWSQGWRPRPEPPMVPRKALLINTAGGLDSTRTITGFPPSQITARAGTYIWDRAAVSDHLVYRRTIR